MSSRQPAPDHDIFDPAALEKMNTLNEPGLPDIVRELVDDFSAKTPARLERITMAFKNRDLVTFQLETHALRSVSAVLGLMSMSDLCAGLEARKKIEADQKVAGELRRLARAFENSRKHFAEYFAKRSEPRG